MEQPADPVGQRVAHLAASLLEESEVLSAAMADRMRAAVPIYRTDLVTAAELQATCFANLHFVFDSMGRAAPTISPESRENGRQRARVGIPLTDVMAAYRIGARFMWEQLSRRATNELAEVVIQAATEMWLVLDVYTQEMAGGYRDEIAFQAATQATERGALVQAILEGAVPDPNLWEAAQALRIPLTGAYVAIVASASTVGKEPLAGLQDRLSARGIASIWHLQPQSESGIVHLGNPTTDLRTVRVALEAADVDRIGLSPVFSDLRAAKASVRLARLALSAATAVRRLVTFEDAPLSILIAGVPEVTEQVVEPILAGLSTFGSGERAVLLATFGAWRDNGGSADRAAAVLFCHPNTVRYRLRRLENATGRVLSDPKAAMELGLAYEYETSRAAASDGIGHPAP
jgi:hypothetical protein